MKKSLLLPLFALVLAACTNDVQTPEPDPEPAGVARNFLSVNLCTPKSASGRAGNGYQDGTAEENNINSVRFYFFDADGNAAPVWKYSATNTYVSYIDWYPTSADQKPGGVEGETVEKIVTATLGINMPATAELPKLVLAVLNPSSDVMALTANPSLTQLRAQVNNYYDGLTNSNFVFTNSVYASNGKTVDATPIEAENFQPTADEAAEKPIYIYVERVLARLDLSIGIENGTEIESGKYIYQVSDKPYVVGGADQNVYVKLLGWNVTATTTASRLVKMISPQWPVDLFADTEPWNADNYRRSFWGINPQENQFTYEYGTFDGKLNTGQPDPNAGNFATALPIPAQGETESVYLQENAAIYSQQQNGNGPAVPSKVIIAAQLVDANGNPLTIAHWANRYYKLDGVLTAVANTLNLYQKTTTPTETTFTQIKPEQLQFVSAEDIYPGGLPDDVGGYYVFVQLSEDAENITWYNGNTQSATAYSTEQANEYIINRVNYVLAWNNGYTYYFFDIRHLGAEGNPGYYGVVRNHLYLANVSSIAGLGTPVYNPDEVIYPEIPNNGYSVISAEIRILQWRVVSQDYPLVWP